MTPEDFDKVYTIWKDLPLSIAPYNEQKSYTLNILKHNPTSCFVATVDEKIVGGILGTFDGVRGWFYHLGIHPDHQRKGYGTALFQATEKALIERGALKLDLFIEKDNLDKAEFYTKEGYELYDGAALLWKKVKK